MWLIKMNYNASKTLLLIMWYYSKLLKRDLQVESDGGVKCIVSYCEYSFDQLAELSVFKIPLWLR